jgi:hypothetical protein
VQVGFTSAGRALSDQLTWTGPTGVMLPGRPLTAFAEPSVFVVPNSVTGDISGVLSTLEPAAAKRRALQQDLQTFFDGSLRQMMTALLLVLLGHKKNNLM